jgi:hypothetical protein
MSSTGCSFPAKLRLSPPAIGRHEQYSFTSDSIITSMEHDSLDRRKSYAKSISSSQPKNCKLVLRLSRVLDRRIAKLKPVRENGLTTAGNASQLSEAT